MPSAHEVSSHIKEQARCEYPSHPRTQADRGRVCRSSITTLASATHPFHSLLLTFFSTVRKAPLDSPADRRLAYPSSANPIRVDLRRFRGLFETGNSARKGEQCHERTRPTLRSFAEKLSGWLELPMRSTLSPRSPARSVSPMAPFGAGSTKTRSTAASEKGSRQRRRKSSADSDAR